MSDIKRLKEKLPKYVRRIKPERVEGRIVSYYCELIKDVFSKTGPNGLIPFVGRRIRVYDENGKSSSKEADLLWDDVLIEFESNLSKTKVDESRKQLCEYLSGCLNENRNKDYKLFSSNGIIFQRYTYSYPQDKKIITPSDIRLEFVGQLDLESRTWKNKKIDYNELYRTISKYLIPAKPDFVPIAYAYELFVPKSELYNKCMRILKSADRKHYAIQFDEWKKYQNLVYGNFIKSQTAKAVEKQYEIFLNHTYMATIAKVLAYATIYPGRIIAVEEKEAILDGRAFNEIQIYNFITEDFFSWIIKDRAIWEGIMDLIFKELGRFDSGNIDRDILRSIYETIEEPEDRHELGAVYTPEWLAEMTLDELFGQRRRRGKNIPRILDPACGSGTFLALAVRKILKEYGSDSPANLLDAILKSVVGFDLHPVAVLFSKTNYLIALRDLIGERSGAISIPVYMADTIDFPVPKSASAQMNTAGYGKVNLYEYSAGGDQYLFLPEDVIEAPDIDMVIDTIQHYAKRISGDRSKIEIYLDGLKKDLARYEIDDAYQIIICDAAKTLACLIEQNRDTIHAFIFKNIYKPALVGDFDIIVGNPPWVVYKNISDESRQDRLKESTRNYGLLGGQETFQAMEMATLFFVRCVDRFLKNGGLIGFVMPRSILQANQHHAFRLWEQNGVIPIQYTLIYDMGHPRKVKNLFTTESCVLFGKKRNGNHGNEINSYQLGGRPGKNSTFDEIRRLMDEMEFCKREATMYLHERQDLSTITTVKDLFLKESVYKEHVSQGATIVPQSFWVVRRVKDRWGTSKEHPFLETIVSPRAKKPWADIVVKGPVSKRYLFSTIYGISIIPFCFTGADLIVVPVSMRERSHKMMNADDLMSAGDRDMAEWVEEVERHWKENRTAKSTETAVEWLDYRKKITDQNPGSDTILLYNRSGWSYLASCLIDVSDLRDAERTSGFIADSSTYYYYPESIEEGKYLCTVLNSRYLFECISAIKASRDIHKTPWEFPIPKFDPDNPDHQKLVKLYEVCHSKIKEMGITKRGETLMLIADEMSAINNLAKKIIIEEYRKPDVKTSVLKGALGSI